MGRIIVTEFVSIDGVMEAPGGGEDFRYAGWTFKINRGKEGDQFKLDEAMSSNALLLGRVKYEGFAKAWPSMKGEFADKFNNMPKYVVSSTLKNTNWNNSTVLNGDVATEVAKLKTSRTETSLFTEVPVSFKHYLSSTLWTSYGLWCFPFCLVKENIFLEKPQESSRSD